MAIHSTPLLVPDALPPMAGGVEIFVNEAHCADVAVNGAGEMTDEFRGVNVLVSFSTDEHDRLAILSLRHTLAFGRFSSAVLDGPDWSERLSKRLKAVDPSFATVSVFVGHGQALAAETVQMAIDAVYAGLRVNPAALVVISGSCHHFASLRGVSGFVRGTGVTDGEVASQVFLLLSSFIGPDASGFDVEDLLPVLGTSDSPTLVANGLWMREGSGRLSYPTEVDRLTVSNAAHVVASLHLPDGGTGRNEMHRFARAVRKDAVKSDCTIYFVTHNALAASASPESVATGSVLCKLRLEG